ncbi:MAG: hypothetical protein AB8W37_10405 [Arsenophonus endosymbiont of Dermacentor nuttalli]
MQPLKSNWDLSSDDGYWINSLLVVNRLNTGFDEIQYGMMKMFHPRLTLLKPLTWQRDANQGKLVGQNPADFHLTGTLSAQQIGPIPFFIRWDSKRLRGTALWQNQSVLAFQSLIPSDLGSTLR